jgi:hypothetical protein
MEIASPRRRCFLAEIGGYPIEICMKEGELLPTSQSLNQLKKLKKASNHKIPGLFILEKIFER